MHFMGVSTQDPQNIPGFLGSEIHQKVLEESSCYLLRLHPWNHFRCMDVKFLSTFLKEIWMRLYGIPTKVRDYAKVYQLNSNTKISILHNLNVYMFLYIHDIYIYHYISCVHMYNV